MSESNGKANGVETWTRELAISSLRLDGGTQSREQTSPKVCEDYAAAMKDGDTFPEVEAVLDEDGNHWLWDGFHRVEAHVLNEMTTIKVRLRRGTQEDARWLSFGALATRGPQRATNADKVRATVGALLCNVRGLSDRALANHVNVSHTFMSRTKRGLLVLVQRKGEADSVLARAADVPHVTMQTIRRSADHYAGKGVELSDRYLIEKVKEEAADVEEASAGPERIEEAAGNGCHAEAAPAGAAGKKSDSKKAPSAGKKAGGGKASTSNGKPKAKATEVPDADAWGIPIQPHARAAFAELPEFRRVADLLREAQKSLTALVDGPGGKLLLHNCQFIKRGQGGRWSLAFLDNALSTIEDCAPAGTDCPHFYNPHLPHPDNCSCCHGARYTGNVKRLIVSAELVASMKEHHAQEAEAGMDDSDEA